MQDILPKSIVWRTDKIGFEPPQKQWMQHNTMQEYIQESRRTLVDKGILNKKIINQPIQSKSAHEADNRDWQYLCAAQCL